VGIWFDSVPVERGRPETDAPFRETREAIDAMKARRHRSRDGGGGPLRLAKAREKAVLCFAT